MNIIREGLKNCPKLFECKNCGCVFEANNKEYTDCNIWEKIIYVGSFSCRCPCCGRKTIC